MKYPKLNSKGFGLLGILAILAVVAMAGVSGWTVYHHNHTTKEIATTSKGTKSAGSTSTTADPYAGWKTYNNTMYGISYKYPSTWTPSNETTYTANQVQQSATKQEFGGGLKLVTDVKYNNTVDIEVLDENLNQAASWYDNLYAQSTLNNVAKTTNTLKGKDSVQYVVTNSGVESKLYLFAVDNKTYVFASINEALNVKAVSDYSATFDKVFGSLQVN